jgi:hypothetical protein
MSRHCQNAEETMFGLRVVTLQNDLLRVQLLPEAGGKIWQITYLPLGEDILWNNSSIAPAKHSMHDSYDDLWSGGWDELFPNDEETTIGDTRFPDHGELWTGSWDHRTSLDQRSATLSFTTPLSGMEIEKTLTLSPGSATIRFHHTLCNTSAKELPFMWKLHPALRVTPHHRVDFPAMQVIREPALPGTLAEAPIEFPWPYARMGTRTVDLRKIPEHDRELYFVYGTNMEAGWCALTNTDTKLSCGLRFDQEIFPCCWLFATYGAWRDHHVAVLEPCTGYPLDFAEMVRAGRHRVLAPGQELSTDVLFTLQQGLRSVSSMDEDGVMHGER